MARGLRDRPYVMASRSSRDAGGAADGLRRCLRAARAGRTRTIPSPLHGLVRSWSPPHTGCPINNRSPRSPPSCSTHVEASACRVSCCWRSTEFTLAASLRRGGPEADARARRRPALRDGWTNMDLGRRCAWSEGLGQRLGRRRRTRGSASTTILVWLRGMSAASRRRDSTEVRAARATPSSTAPPRRAGHAIEPVAAPLGFVMRADRSPALLPGTDHRHEARPELRASADRRWPRRDSLRADRHPNTASGSSTPASVDGFDAVVLAIGCDACRPSRSCGANSTASTSRWSYLLVLAYDAAQSLGGAFPRRPRSWSASPRARPPRRGSISAGGSVSGVISSGSGSSSPTAWLASLAGSGDHRTRRSSRSSSTGFSWPQRAVVRVAVLGVAVIRGACSCASAGSRAEGLFHILNAMAADLPLVQQRALVDAGDEGLEDAERGSADVGQVYEFAEARKAKPRRARRRVRDGVGADGRARGGGGHLGMGLLDRRSSHNFMNRAPRHPEARPPRAGDA